VFGLEPPEGGSPPEFQFPAAPLLLAGLEMDEFVGGTHPIVRRARTTCSSRIVSAQFANQRPTKFPKQAISSQYTTSHLHDLSHLIRMLSSLCVCEWFACVFFHPQPPLAKSPTPSPSSGTGARPTPDTWTAADAETPVPNAPNPSNPPARRRPGTTRRHDRTVSSPSTVHSTAMTRAVYMHLRAPRASDSVQEAHPAGPPATAR
jgi:hypothetical protein